jgi:hypothetical protein
MYQPKIEDEHIRALYRWAQRLEMPMTRLVNALLAHALVRLEQGVENVSEAAREPYRHQYPRRKRSARYGRATRQQTTSSHRGNT